MNYRFTYDHVPFTPDDASFTIVAYGRKEGEKTLHIDKPADFSLALQSANPFVKSGVVRLYCHTNYDTITLKGLFGPDYSIFVTFTPSAIHIECHPTTSAFTKEHAHLTLHYLVRTNHQQQALFYVHRERRLTMNNRLKISKPSSDRQ
ncbi:hypothetical protein [Bacillus coahuilensis]|uniref:hypothetical protein n=1 Tax=Bacillus coahuilensis TaxID=408580 RepID=UPI0004941C4F|nr:hypothetical protein [Bacillus coahuilensis]